MHFLWPLSDWGSCRRSLRTNLSSQGGGAQPWSSNKPFSHYFRTTPRRRYRRVMYLMEKRKEKRVPHLSGEWAVVFSGWIQNVFQWLRREDAKRLFLKPKNNNENSPLQDKTGLFAGMNVPFFLSFFLFPQTRKEAPLFSPPPPTPPGSHNHQSLSFCVSLKNGKKRFFEGRGMSRCQALRGK